MPVSVLTMVTQVTTAALNTCNPARDQDIPGQSLRTFSSRRLRPQKICPKQSPWKIPADIFPSQFAFPPAECQSLWAACLISDHSRSCVVSHFSRVCLSVCSSVCMYFCQTITFESLYKGSSFFVHPVYLEGIPIKFLYEGHRVKVKVTGATTGRKSRNVKVPSAVTPVLWKIEPWSLRVAWVFWIWRIEWCDRHLCHVTTDDHV